MVRIFFIILFLASNAFANCPKPSEPYCIENAATYEEDNAYDFCKRKVTDYAASVQTFINCTQNEANDIMSGAQNELKEGVTKFNCRSGGKEEC